jgi:hypothetical protein
VPVGGSDATAVPNSTTDPTIIDTVLDAQEAAPPAPEEEDKVTSTSDVAAEGMPRGRLNSKLRYLLRLRR